MHVEQTRLFALQKLRRAQAALSIASPTARAVSDFKALTQAAEINRVVTDDISATHDRKADRTCLARPGVTMARPGGNIVKRFTPSLRNSLGG